MTLEERGRRTRRSGPRTRICPSVELVDCISSLSGTLSKTIGTFKTTSATGERATTSHRPMASNREITFKPRFCTKMRLKTLGISRRLRAGHSNRAGGQAGDWVAHLRSWVLLPASADWGPERSDAKAD